MEIERQLDRRGIARVVIGGDVPRDVRQFVNAGHLNDRGAQRFSALLGEQLRRMASDAKADAGELRAK